MILKPAHLDLEPDEEFHDDVAFAKQMQILRWLHVTEEEIDYITNARTRTALIFIGLVRALSHEEGMTCNQWLMLNRLAKELRRQHHSPQLHTQDLIDPMKCRLRGEEVMRPVEACIIDLRNARTLETITRSLALIPEMKEGEHLCGIDKDGLVRIGTADEGHDLHPIPTHLNELEAPIQDSRRLH